MKRKKKATKKTVYCREFLRNKENPGISLNHNTFEKKTLQSPFFLPFFLLFFKEKT